MNREILGALLLVAVMLTSGGLAILTVAAPASGAPAPSTPVPTTSSAGTASAPTPAAGGSVDQVSGTFYSVNSTMALPNQTALDCYKSSQAYNYTFGQYYYYDSYCTGGPQNPSEVHLGGNHVGVGYSQLTNSTPQSSCLFLNGSAMGITSGVAFKTSSNAGQSWGKATWISTGSCTYVQSFEPSFATSNGTIYGAFVESNFTNPNASLRPTLPMEYAPRLSSALGFTVSTNGGSTFSTAVTIPQAGTSNISYPEVAAFGQTVYIVYMNTTNNTNLTLPTSAYGVAPTYPMSVEMVYSQDGGATWNGPIDLPGLNASDDFAASSPAIAVNSTGGIAVSYATNRQCIYYYGFCDYYGDSIVASTSTTNGTTWHGPVVVWNLAGESPCTYYDPLGYYSCLAGMFDWGPHSSIAFDPNAPARLYVTWVGADYTWTTSGGGGEGGGGTTINFGFGSALYAAVSTNGGLNWTTSNVEVPVSSSGYDYDSITAPAITVGASGMVYIAFVWLNQTYCPSGNCPFSDLPSYWIASSTNGLTWGSRVAYVSPIDVYELEDDWTGLSSAVTVTTAGAVSVYSLGNGYTDSFSTRENLTHVPPIYYDWFNETYTTNLIDAFPSTLPPVAVNFTEAGLTANTTWGFTLSGNEFSSNDSTIQVTDVPFNATVYFEAEPVPAGGWTELIPTASVSDTPTFSGPTTVFVNYTTYYGLGFSITPWGISGTFASNTFVFALVEVDFQIDNTFYYYEQYHEYDGFLGVWFNNTYQSSPFPWYVQAGTVLGLSTIVFTEGIPLSYVFGTGNGSATGVPNQVSMTVNGPINETYVVGVLGHYNVSFVPSGLASGTPYSFSFDGTTYSGTAPNAVIVPDVTTGAYALSDVSAQATAGWVYYASGVGSEVDVPVQIQVDLNFTTQVDVGAPAGLVTFEAAGLSSGSFWQVEFNGTTYGSTTPWINVTAHPGNYSVSAVPISAAANETTAYTPVGFGPTLSVMPGSTYLVSYSLTYRVDVSTSTGGSVSGAGAHWATPGSTASYVATPNPGYAFLGWAGSGSGSYTGSSSTANITVNSPITESARFQGLPADRFTLAITETGLPSGSWWTVEVNGSGYSSNQSTLLINNLYSCSAGALGQYSVSVPYVYLNGSAGVRYLGSGFPSSTCTTGSTALSLTFHAQYLVTPQSSTGGTGFATVGGLAATTPTWASAGTPVSLSARPATGYQFSEWLGTGPGSYTGTQASQVIDPTGAVSELALFTPIVIPSPARYTASFQLGSSLAPGTAWSITFNGTTYASTSSWINVTGLLPNTYSLSVGAVYSPDRGTEYTPQSPPGSIVLSANQTTTVSYGVAYLVTVSGSAGGTAGPSGTNNYYASGRTLTLTAVPAAGYEFVGWTGTGSGSYSGTTANGTVTVSAPISEVATFAPIPASTSGSSNFLTSTTGIVVLAIVGLVVGLAIGVVAFRRRREPSAPPQTWSNEGGKP